MIATSDTPRRGSLRISPDRPSPGLAESHRELQSSRLQTDRLFRLVSPDNIYLRPLPQRHRLIFYLGHLEAFDWNQIGRATLQQGHLHPTFDQLFERGIDPEPGQLPADQPADWPSLEETLRYVANVRERIDALWNRATESARYIAIEHRWMHAETLAYLLHNLPPDRKINPDRVLSPPAHPAEVRHRFIEIPSGVATLGRPRDSGFGWDNEFPETKIPVPAFSIAKYKVTNGDYLEFVNQGQPAPHFWIRVGDAWHYRGMFATVPLPLDAPVYVTQSEASAFARSRGAELATEAQFHRAAFGTPAGAETDAPWGNAAPDPLIHGNFDFQNWDPVSVLDHPAGASAFGVEQLIGNGWEWTSTPFGPFPGFQPAPTYPGYSADFFDNQHFVIKGASPQTAACLTRRSLRNWFRPDYPYLYATFRLVKN